MFLAIATRYFFAFEGREKAFLNGNGAPRSTLDGGNSCRMQ